MKNPFKTRKEGCQQILQVYQVSFIKFVIPSIKYMEKIVELYSVGDNDASLLISSNTPSQTKFRGSVSCHYPSKVEQPAISMRLSAETKEEIIDQGLAFLSVFMPQITKEDFRLIRHTPVVI